MKMIYTDNNNQLHNSILSGDTIEVNPNIVDIPQLLQERAWGNTPLLLACKTANFKAAEKILDLHKQYKVQLNIQDNRGMSPLHWACFYRENVLIQQLIEAGINIELLNNHYQTAGDIYVKPFDEGVRVKNPIAGFSGKIRELINDLKKMPEIAEGQVELYSPWTSCTDILFHMDKIGNYYLSIHDKINQENSSVQSTSVFFKQNIKAYFFDFVSQREARDLSEDIINSLQPTSANIYEEKLKLIAEHSETLFNIKLSKEDARQHLEKMPISHQRRLFFMLDASVEKHERMSNTIKP